MIRISDPSVQCRQRSQSDLMMMMMIIIIIIIIQFFIISVLHQQPEDQLQMQHKGGQNNKYNKITTIRL
jgi:hypothetical protein